MEEYEVKQILNKFNIWVYEYFGMYIWVEDICVYISIYILHGCDGILCKYKIM